MPTQWKYLLIAGLAGLLGGCGVGGIGGGPGPCAGDSPPPECGERCAGSDDCAAGYYCAGDGACTADCTAGGNQCVPGQYCTADGRCAGEDDINRPDAHSCPSALVSLEPVTPIVVVVIDQSGSMSSSFNGPTRWEAVRTALVDPTNGVITQLQSTAE